MSRLYCFNQLKVNFCRRWLTSGWGSTVTQQRDFDSYVIAIVLRCQWTTGLVLLSDCLPVLVRMPGLTSLFFSPPPPPTHTHTIHFADLICHLPLWISSLSWMAHSMACPSSAPRPTPPAEPPLRTFSQTRSVKGRKLCAVLRHKGSRFPLTDLQHSKTGRAGVEGSVWYSLMARFGGGCTVQ